MAEFLILKLQGVLQAWGGHTYEDLRPSHPFPTRSGLIGLLAACLGLERKDEPAQQQLADSFLYAVRADKRPYRTQKITDFHTVLNGRNVDGSIRETAILTLREYLCDAHFTVALKFEKDAVYGLNKIVEAVKRPCYTPFLGRRCCALTRPLYESLVQAGDIYEALAQIAPSEGIIYSELNDNSDNRLEIRDVPAFNGHRLFGTRTISISGQKKSEVNDVIS
jgi:CRISPR system Cascade subunit CasD